MKEGWERHTEIIMLTEGKLLKIIKLYDPSLKFSHYELLSGGLSHTNYKVFLQNNDLILVIRLSRDSENLWKEYRIHNDLFPKRTIPKFYHVGEYEDVCFGVLEWKAGILLKDTLSVSNSSETFNVAYALGVELGSLKQLQFNNSGFLDADLNVIVPFDLTPDVFLSTMENFLFNTKVHQWLQEGLAEKLMNFCESHSQLFLADTSKPRLVHGDFNGLNILMNYTDVSAILDWEFGLAGSMFWDIGNLLRYKALPHYHEFESGLQKGLTESGEQLPEEWIKIARVTDLVSLCSMLDNDYGGVNKVRDINKLIKNIISDSSFL